MAFPERLMRLVRRRRPVRKCTAATATVLAALGLVAAGAQAGSAATSPAYTLTSGHVSFSADHHTWTLGFGVTGGKSGTDQLVLTIETKYLSGSEYHGWTTDKLPAKDLKVSSNGKATLDTGSALSPVLKLDLTFGPAKHAKAVCLSGSGTDYTGKLSGTVSLTTGLKGIKVSKKFTFGNPDTLEVSNGCVATPCLLGDWATGITAPPTTLNTQATGEASGTPGHLSWIATVARAGIKTAARLLTRTDGGYLTVKAPTGALSVTTSSSGIVTGSATFTPFTVVTLPSVSCLLNGKKYADKVTDEVGTYASSPTLTAHTLLTGNISVAPAGGGLFTIDTLTGS
jgi:hypothetical protein